MKEGSHLHNYHTVVYVLVHLFLYSDVFFVSTEMKIRACLCLCLATYFLGISSKDFNRKIRKRFKLTKNTLQDVNLHAKTLKSEPSSSITLSTALILKKEICRTKRFRQVISYPGCIDRSITNKLCYGRCHSFYIPNGSGFITCGQCRPDKYQTIGVKLFCPGKSFKFVKKNILKIKSCQCVSQTANN